jgi:hypothetical protein
MTNAERVRVHAQHAELIDLAKPYTHKLLGMDANETTHAKGRIQIRKDGTTTYSGSGTGYSNQTAPLDAYRGVMRNALEHHANEQRRKHGTHVRPPFPARRDMTHTQPGRNAADDPAGIKTILSQIDTIMLSNSILPRVQYGEVDARTRYWGRSEKARKSYHSALVISLVWDDMWRQEDKTSPAGTSKQPLLGSTLRPFPNYAALTPEKESTISRRVNTVLLERWRRLRGIMRAGRGKKGQSNMARLTQLVNILNNTVLNAAKSVLSTTTPAPPPDDEPLFDLESKWDDLVKLIGAAIGATMDGHVAAGPKPRLDSPAVTEARAELAAQGVRLPSKREDWINWWHRRDYHKAEALNPSESLTLTDSMAASDPKRFYAQATKPLASSRIHALHASSWNWGTNYLRRWHREGSSRIPP